MQTKSFLRAAIGVSLLTPAIALAGPDAGDRSFTLSGGGASDDSFDVSTYSVSSSIGWFTTDTIELGVRQNLSGVAVDDGDDSWAGATRGYADFHLGTGSVMPFVGVNIGAIYGDGVNDTGTAGVEAGAKFYVKEKTFILLQAEYQFLFEDADEIDDQFDDGAFFYTLGVGFNF